MQVRLAFVAVLAVPLAGCLSGLFESGPCGWLVTMPSVLIRDSTTGKGVCDATVIAAPAGLDGATPVVAPAVEGGFAPGDAATDAAAPGPAGSFMLQATPSSTDCVYTSSLFAWEGNVALEPTYAVVITKPGYRTATVTVSVSVTTPSSCLANDEIVTSNTPVQVALTPN